MFRNTFLLFSFLFATHVVFAQNKYEEALPLLWEQIQHLKYHHPDSSVSLTKHAITLAEAGAHDLWTARLFLELSLGYIEISEIDSAQYANQKSRKINTTLQHGFNLAMNTFVDGYIFSQRSQFVEAAANYLTAVEESKNHNNANALMYAYRGLANMYINQRNEELALQYAKEALKEAKKSNTPIEEAYSKKVLAEAYRVFENLDAAEVLFTEAYQFFSENNNPFGKAKTLVNWSIMYEEQLDKCLTMEFEAQDILDKIAPTSGYAISNMYNIGWGFYDLYNLYPNVPESFKQYSKDQFLKEARFHFENSLAAAKKCNNKQWEMFNIGILADVLYLQKSFEKAYELNNAYSKLKDSLFSQSNKNKIAELENRQKILEKDREIEFRELNISQKEKEKWYLLAGLGLLSIVGLLLWNQNRIRKKNNDDLRKLNKALTEANTFKAKLFSILNHDLRSPLSNLINLINLKNDHPELLPEATRGKLENKILSAAQNVLVSMEDLLIWCKNQMEQFEPKFESCQVSKIFDEIKRYFANYEGITFFFEIEEVPTFKTDINYLNTICRNLTLNAISAVINEEQPTIKWHCIQKGHELVFSISDNGKGFSMAESAFINHRPIKSVTQGLGLQIIEELTLALQGRIEIGQNNLSGCSISIRLPISPKNNIAPIPIIE